MARSGPTAQGLAVTGLFSCVWMGRVKLEDWYPCRDADTDLPQRGTDWVSVVSKFDGAAVTMIDGRRRDAA